jgi:hypothetical protein
VDGTSGTASAIAAGAFHTCAIQAGSDAVVCWGENFFGQATPPAEVDGTTGTASAIAAGAFHSLALRQAAAAVPSLSPIAAIVLGSLMLLAGSRSLGRTRA